MCCIIFFFLFFFIKLLAYFVEISIRLWPSFFILHTFHFEISLSCCNDFKYFFFAKVLSSTFHLLKCFIAFLFFKCSQTLFLSFKCFHIKHILFEEHHYSSCIVFYQKSALEARFDC